MGICRDNWKLAVKNKILTLELADGGKWHTIIKLIVAGILVRRGYDVSSGREYLSEVGVNPDLVAKKTTKITSDKGKKRKVGLEYWIEVIDTSDRHLEKHEVINGITDIIKIRLKDIKFNKPMASIIEGIEYTLPE
jgi:hypothetical protein